MATGRFISYYRVSTERQGRSGLGLDAQKQAVRTFLNGGDWDLIGEFTEVESGKNNNRPELGKALAVCRLKNARLVIAKLDRLSRDAHFLLGLQNAGVDFVCADMPQADSSMVGFMAIIAQHERRMISERTKAALAAAKARGVKLGNPENLSNQKLGSERGNAAKAEKAQSRAADLLPVIADIRAEGHATLTAIASALNARGFRTARGGDWAPTQVARVLAHQGGA